MTLGLTVKTNRPDTDRELSSNPASVEDATEKKVCETKLEQEVLDVSNIKKGISRFIYSQIMQNIKSKQTSHDEKTSHHVIHQGLETYLTRRQNGLSERWFMKNVTVAHSLA